MINIKTDNFQSSLMFSLLIIESLYYYSGYGAGEGWGGGGGWGFGQKAPSTTFSPLTSTNVGLNPQNLLNFSFNPFVALV